MDSNVNKKHKDSVFSALFSNPQILRELYSAIEGVDVPPDAVVNINTLSDAIYMRQINDVSFTINDRIVVLAEHQSTINENVPLRLLMYIARIYEKIIEREKLYRKKLMKIPTPEFIVLYNGKEQYPDRRELKLSTSFKDTLGLKKEGNSELPLELTVRVYNINHGRNPEILNKSKHLNDYSIFIAKIKEYNDKQSLEESVTNAVKYCVKCNILKEFLTEHGSEVLNMLFDDISIEEIVAVRCEEAREEGLEQGLAKGRETEKLEIAKNLAAVGISSDVIFQTTGLKL